MATTGDISVLQFGSDNLWHYIFLTPSVLSTFQFNTGSTAPVLAALGTQIVADTGWTANGTAGDKTVAVQAYVNGITGTMVTALNVTSGGLGTALSALADQLAAVTKKLAAHETALVAGKIPNA